MFACDACGDVFNNAIHARTHDLRKCSASSSSAVVIPVTSSTVTVLPILMADDDIDFGQQPDEIVNIPNQNSGPSHTIYLIKVPDYCNRSSYAIGLISALSRATYILLFWISSSRPRSPVPVLSTCPLKRLYAHIFCKFWPFT